MSDPANCNKYAMPWPYSISQWLDKGNTHKSVIYVYYGLHNIDLVCDSWVITQFSQLLPQTYVSLKSLKNFQQKSSCLSKCPVLLPYTNQHYLHVDSILLGLNTSYIFILTTGTDLQNEALPVFFMPKSNVAFYTRRHLFFHPLAFPCVLEITKTKLWVRSNSSFVNL